MDEDFGGGWFGGDGTDISDDSGWSDVQNSITPDSPAPPATNFGLTDPSQVNDIQMQAPSMITPSADDNANTSTSGGGSSIFGSVGAGAAAGSAFGPWGTVIGAGLGLVSGIFSGKSKEDQLKLQEQEQEKLYAYQLAEQEKYYQAHGQQLEAAYDKYKPFAMSPGPAGPNGGVGLMPGLAAPQSGGPSGYFH